MAPDTLEIELVVSSWPFRTGIIVYEPVNQLDIWAWDLDLLADEPDVLARYEHILNPLLSYRERADAVLAELAAEQEFLHAVFSSEDDPRRFVPVLSDSVQVHLKAFCDRHALHLAHMSLSRLPALLDALEAMVEADHHAACADWWESFARPAGSEGVSAFRRDAGPGGGLYVRNAAGDRAAGLEAWRADQRVTVGEFTLWHALRVHWAWRLEFSDQPRPRFDVFEQLAAMFPRRRR